MTTVSPIPTTHLTMWRWHSSHWEVGSVFFCLWIWVGLWARWKWHHVTVVIKDSTVSALFAGKIAFGVLSCNGRSPRLPCCQEAHATWREHTEVFWPRIPAKVPSNSQHQPPHRSNAASTWLWPPAIESSLLRPQVLGNMAKSPALCPIRIPDPQNLRAQ